MEIPDELYSPEFSDLLRHSTASMSPISVKNRRTSVKKNKKSITNKSMINAGMSNLNAHESVLTTTDPKILVT